MFAPKNHYECQEPSNTDLHSLSNSHEQPDQLGYKQNKEQHSLDFHMVELHSWLILYALKSWKKNFVFKYKTTLGLPSGKRKQVFCLNSSCTVYALRDVQRHQPLSTQRQRCPPHTCSETLGESMVSTKVLWERN